MEFFLGGRQVKKENTTSAAITPEKMLHRREMVCLFGGDTGHPRGSGPAPCSAPGRGCTHAGWSAAGSSRHPASERIPWGKQGTETPSESARLKIGVCCMGYHKQHPRCAEGPAGGG